MTNTTKRSGMTRILSMMLVLIMVVSLMPAVHVHAASTPSLTITNAEGEVATSFSRGEAVMVSATGVEEGTWVALYEADSDTKYMFWTYVTAGADPVNLFDGGYSGGWDGYFLPYGTETGTYEIKLIDEDNNVLVTKNITFTTPDEPASESLTVEKTEIEGVEIVRIKPVCYTDVSWVGIYLDNDYTNLTDFSNKASDHYFYTVGHVNAYKDMLLEGGTHTIVLFGDGGKTDVIDTALVTVSETEDPGTEPGDPSGAALSTDKTEYKYGDPILVSTTYSGGKDWIGIYKKGETYDPDNGGSYSIFWYYIADEGRTNVDITKMADKNGRKDEFVAGDYTISLFTNDSYTSVATVDITITKEVVTVETVTPATCEKDGSKVTTYTDGTKETTPIPELGHDYSENWIYDELTGTHSHICEKDSTHKQDTDYCSWDEGVVTTEPTAEKPGVKTYTCGVCKGTKTEPVKYQVTETGRELTTDPTCEKPGEWTITYSDGSKDYVSEPAKGHAYPDAWTKVAGKMEHQKVCANDSNHVITEACDYVGTDGGFVKNDKNNIEENPEKGGKYFTCGECGGEEVASFYTTDKTEYEYGEPIKVITNYTNCGETQVWVGMYEEGVTPGPDKSVFWYFIPGDLDITSAPYEKAISEISTSSKYEGTGQSYAINSAGSKTYNLYMFDGGSNYTPMYSKPITITVKNKLVKTEKVDPTCTEDGYMLDTYADEWEDIRYADRMTEAELAEYGQLKKLGHDWNDWAPVANYAKEGTTKEHTHSCKRDGCTATETESCAATTTKQVTTEATVDKDGVETHTCSECNGSYTTAIPALNKVGDKITTPATCEKDGSIILRSKDGSFADIVIEVLPKKDHAYGSKWEFDQVNKDRHSKTCANHTNNVCTCEAPVLYDDCNFEVTVDETAGTVEFTCTECGGGYSQESLVVTDKKHYGFNEPIMVTAYTHSEGAWVGIYRTDDLYDPTDGGVTSVCYYNVGDNYGKPVDMLKQTMQRYELGLGGEFEVVLFGDQGYGNVLGKTTITTEPNDQTYTLSVNGKEVKTGDALEFTKGESIKVKADYAGVATNAWVGLYTSEMGEGADFEKQAAAWYWLDDEKGTDHAFDLLQSTSGTYAVVVFADGGYDNVKVNVTIKVRPKEVKRETLQEYPCLPGTIKITYEEPLYVDEEGNPGPDYEFIPVAATAQHKYDKTTYNNNGTHSTACSVCSTKKSGSTPCSFTWKTENGKHTGTCSVCNGVKTGSCTYGAPVDKDGKHVYTCGTCKGEKSEDCTYGGWTYNTTAKTHSASCSKCGDVKTEDCKFDEGVVTKLPTATAEGEKTFTCSVCKGGYTEAVPVLQQVETTRIFGSNRYETAFKTADVLKKQLGVEKFDNVIIACGTNFADALAGSYLAAVKNAPILLVDKARISKVTSYIKTNVKAGGTVYILGGENAVPKNMESGLGGFDVERLAGSNRYETNLMILKAAGVSADTPILVATGTNFADSLSASATGKPILLVNKKLTAAQKNFLKGTKGTKYILGGENAVSADIEKELKAYGEVKRLGGANRYATSTLIAKTFFKNPSSAVLAYAQNFPDGLCGGVVAYKQGAPMLLVIDGNGAKAATTYAKEAGIKSGYALGGSGLIADKTIRQIFSMGANDAIK